MIYTLSKTDKKEPGPTEAIFFTKPNYQGDAYIAYVGFEVDFGKGLKDIPDSLNNNFHSLKTGNIKKELKNKLDIKRLQGEVKEVKDKLDDCEKHGKELKQQLDKSEQQKHELKNKLGEYEKK
ncbi:hypothetical protein [Rickettsiella endosymbiont of Rhagonycha lignosa]|uniref:hypothetical protein n=1 Tax=Rickettsiella endosymbiont of Rhagonycha lignosa TaxID=3077937 RepID=UPI00313C1B67